MLFEHPRICKAILIVRLSDLVFQLVVSPNENQVGFLQQDNLRIHYVNEATEFVDSKGLKIMTIPRYSPEHAPIGNAFAVFKRKVHEQLRDSQVRSADELWEMGKTC